jgi:hypothetical protein
VTRGPGVTPGGCLAAVAAMVLLLLVILAIGAGIARCSSADCNGPSAPPACQG